MAMERYEVHGAKVYQLNICEALGDHHLCPGITTLKAGDFDLGTLACNCPCHKKPKIELPTLTAALLAGDSCINPTDHTLDVWLTIPTGTARFTRP